MTDREIAIEIGKRLIAAHIRIAAMTGELDTYRDKNTLQDIPWRRHVDQTVTQELSHVSEAKLEELSNALDAANPEVSLHTLHRFLAESLNLPRLLPP